MTQNKNKKSGLFFFILIGFACISILAASSTVGSNQNGKITFAPLFQLLGMAPQSLGRSVAKVLPINSLDEAELGKSLRPYYIQRQNPNHTKTLAYLNTLIKSLQKFKKKPFEYEVFLIQSKSPNAMALPGGIILVTQGLLETLKSESELVSVLAHEMGHIEMSHTFDLVKYELLTKKIIHSKLGQVADFTRNLLLRTSFSKTQENEADVYGFQLLTHNDYDPSSMSKAFLSFIEHSGASQSKSEIPNPFRDYFLSHPPLEQRASKFLTEAQLWWNAHPSEKRYIGVQNIEEKIDLSIKDFGPHEWTSSDKPPEFTVIKTLRRNLGLHIFLKIRRYGSLLKLRPHYRSIFSTADFEAGLISIF